MRCTRVLNLTGEYAILRIAPTAIAVTVTPTAPVNSGCPRRGSRKSVARMPPTRAASSGIGYGPPGSFQRPSNLAMTMPNSAGPRVPLRDEHARRDLPGSAAVRQPRNGVFGHHPKRGQRADQSGQDHTDGESFQRGCLVLGHDVQTGRNQGRSTEEQVHRERDPLVLDIGPDVPDRCSPVGDMCSGPWREAPSISEVMLVIIC